MLMEGLKEPSLEILLLCISFSCFFKKSLFEWNILLFVTPDIVSNLPLLPLHLLSLVNKEVVG